MWYRMLTHADRPVEVHLSIYELERLLEASVMMHDCGGDRDIRNGLAEILSKAREWCVLLCEAQQVPERGAR